MGERCKGIPGFFPAAMAVSFLLAPLPWVGGSPVSAQPASNPGAADRLQAALDAAEVGPGLAARRAVVDAEAAGILVGAGVGPPALSWLREGIGPSFDERPNAVDHLSLSLPFNGPGQRSRARALDAAAAGWQGAAREAGRLEEVTRVGRLWLDLAAAVERAEVARLRTERLERLLALQQKRLELGEVAGAEVLQLELQHAAGRTVLQASSARRDTLAAELGLLLLGEASLPGSISPVLGDLEALSAKVISPEPDQAALDAKVPDGPAALEARSRAELAEKRHDLQRRTAWGRPEAVVEWQRIPTVQNAEGYDAVALGVSVPLPFGGAGRRQRELAAAEGVAARQRGELLNRTLAAEAVAARTAAVAARASLDALRPTLARLTFAERSLTEQFRLGAISYLALIDGLARLDEVRGQAIDARYNLLTSRLELARLLGDPLVFPLPEPGEEAQP